jgi:hypothetical protein
MDKIDLIIKVLKDWRETADKFGFDSPQAKKKGAIAMPLLFENRELLPESNQRFALRALEGRFTIDGIKTLNDGGYCDFYADKNFIADLASERKKDAEKPAETEQKNKNMEGEREGTIAPKPPDILQKILWILKYGPKNWKLLLIAGLILFILALIKFNPFRSEHLNINSKTIPGNVFKSGHSLQKLAGSCEVADIVHLFVDGVEGWARWDTGAQPGTPIAWITEDKYDDPPEDMGSIYGVFARHGKVVLTIQGKPIYQQMKQTVVPGEWEIWLVGPNAGIVVVKIESEYGSDLPFDISEVLSKAGFKITLYKDLKERNTTGNFILYHIEPPAGGNAWIAESWSIGTAGGAQEIWIIYEKHYADILWEKEGSLGKQHLLWERESNEASRPDQ